MSLGACSPACHGACLSTLWPVREAVLSRVTDMPPHVPEYLGLCLMCPTPMPWACVAHPEPVPWAYVSGINVESPLGCCLALPCARLLGPTTHA